VAVCLFCSAQVRPMDDDDHDGDQCLSIIIIVLFVCQFVCARPSGVEWSGVELS